MLCPMFSLTEPVVVLGMVCAGLATVWMVVLTLQMRTLLEWLEAINHAIEVVGLELKKRR